MMPRPHEQESSRSHRDCPEVRVPSRYVNSVSDLYGSDEIEMLLEEIRELTPGSFHTDSFQDFEIDGSRTGMNVVEEQHCESMVSIHSWDSHAVYHQQVEETPPDDPIFTGVVMYCDNTHFKSCTGVLRVILVISSVACLACLCSSGTTKVGLFLLPLLGRLRFMIFVTVFTLLLTCLLLFLDISHLVYVLPFNWSRLNALLYVCVSVMYLISSSLVMNTVQIYESCHWIPKWTSEQLFISWVFGYFCAMEALLLSLTAHYGSRSRRPKHEEVDHMSLVERRRNTIKYEVPSTSTMWPIDDVQPCSSKHLQPPVNTYHVA